MRDVALLAGVGKTTVSLALRNDPRIKAQTREKIQAAAAELGYRADAAVSQVMATLRRPSETKFRGTFAVIDLAPVPGREADRAPDEILGGCESRANELGYSLDRFLVGDPRTDLRRLPKVILSRGIRAILYVGSSIRRSLPAEIASALDSYPSVAVELSEDVDYLHRADTDIYGGVYRAVAHCMRLGYRRPCLAVDPEEDWYVSHRIRAGFLAGCHAAATEEAPIFEVRGEAGREWFDRFRPDAIFVSSPALAETINPGPGIGCLLLDRSPDHDGWAGIDRNRQAVGAAAIDLLSSQVYRNESGPPASPKQVLVRPRWVDGPSLPDRRGTAPEKRGGKRERQ
jgi:DNA-binding LacI/PurR family transcriptional regulator